MGMAGDRRTKRPVSSENRRQAGPSVREALPEWCQGGAIDTIEKNNNNVQIF